MLAGNNLWCADSPLDDTDDQAAAGHPPPTAQVIYSRKQSVEQIAHDMLMQAFREASREHHPDRGGDPEDMRRICAARDMILREIHKP